MALLDKKDNYMLTFNDKWYTGSKDRKPYQVYDNVDVTYSYFDFDQYVLNVEDLKSMTNWAEELKLKMPADGPVSLFKQIVVIKKSPYKKLTDAQLRYFCRCSWISMRRKGELLINAFKEQFLPKVKNVMAVQKFTNIKDDDTGDVINGYIDMVLEIEGYDKPIIFDLKTAARAYTEQQIELTEQLTLYAAMDAHNFKTNLVGYCVLVKNIGKDMVGTCETCGHTRVSNRTRKCDKTTLVGKTKTGKDKLERCNGKWLENYKLLPQVQVLVKEKTPEEINALLVDQGNILHGMKERVVYKDTSKCYNWFGGKCPFFNACHKNDFSGLKKRS